MGVEETREAICAAHRAFEKWKNTTYIERYQLMKRWAKAIEEHANDLALILTLENGKPLEQALSEVNDSCNYIHWYAEESKRIYGNVLPAPLPNQRFMTVKQPVGVCSVITPWSK
jgi:succinate-semialdehyde dehydrogenase/glutarate-semialdehyde dehydrogenase